MWVELTEHFADDTGALLGWLVGTSGNARATMTDIE